MQSDSNLEMGRPHYVGGRISYDVEVNDSNSSHSNSQLDSPMSTSTVPDNFSGSDEFSCMLTHGISFFANKFYQ